ncbi:DUF5947 family protein [Methylosinus sp. Sm6]|uniref:DUF5947 family protein n=1 Tax=Methylosinus sp. Sm6 TaxID=2866948 RepID=UPI001C990962|nr:DUF5947 family protein [Methylosinus sp. Sm6]MBY6242552.1 DUF5947 family protein [Methylosinus sp. Sm6]
MTIGWVSRIRRFVADDGRAERCELCGAALDAAHRHVMEPHSRRILCACEACIRASAGGPLRVIVPATLALADFTLPDDLWDSLQIPIDLAFLLESGEERRPLAIYPSPAGGIESVLSEDAWSALAAANPILFDMTPDVEALLVDRRGAGRYFRVSIDRCYALIGLVRARWEGLSGGARLWDEVERFFASLSEAPEQGLFVHG